MKPWPTRLLLLGGASTLLLAIPALSQEAEPVLPPGFGQPSEPPPQPQQPTQEPTTPPPGFGETAPAAPAAPRPAPRSSLPGLAETTEEEVAQIPVRPAELFDVPEDARLSPDIVGALGPANGGLGPQAFGDSSGAFLAGLMRRLDAPLPSRWTSMLLRRALLSRVPAPRHVDPVDWVAERAGLLLDMGEADAARMLVQSVDRSYYTPAMVQAAVQTALATSDPAALCPLVGPGRRISNQPIWTMSDAMCAALSGENASAAATLSQARNREGVGPIDYALAEKIVGAAADVRRAVTIDWDRADTLNPWRFGLATAAGLALPERLLSAAPAHISAWYARAPMVPLEQRIAAAEAAAVLGVFSNRSLVDIHSLMLDGADPAEMGESIGVRLRQAYAHRDPARRIAAMEALWDDAGNPAQRYARLILTAVAASRIAPAEAHAEQASDLIASMLSAGLDREAGRWASLTQAADDDRAWALLAVGAPRPQVEISAGRFERFRSNDDSEGGFRSRMLLAALAGLGRIDGDSAQSLASDMDLRLGREDSWTRAIEAAARARQPGTVALLAAVGMQTGHWTGVPPEHLFRIVRALSQVGLEFEARMIAAEALSRL